MSGPPSYDRTAAAAEVVLRALDDCVADEATAMTALAIALGRRIGAFAASPATIAYGISKVHEVIAAEAASAHFLAKARIKK